MRMLSVAPVLLGLCVTPAPAQSPAANPETTPRLTFEVASIKPAKPDMRQGGFIQPLPGGQTYRAENAPLRLMIKLMYKINDQQIVGGPDWMNTDLWDVEAKAEHATTLDNLHIMFQNMLVDRFQLKFHKETKELPAFVLTLDKHGSKLKANDSPEPWDIPIQPAGPRKIKGTRVPMTYFCWWISQLLNEPVVNQTGLNGNYDFTLELPPPPDAPPPAPGEPDQRLMMSPSDMSPDLFAAMKEQLGIVVEKRKAPVEVFVIDHVEKPGEN